MKGTRWWTAHLTPDRAASDTVPPPISVGHRLELSGNEHVYIYIYIYMSGKCLDGRRTPGLKPQTGGIM